MRTKLSTAGVIPARFTIMLQPNLPQTPIKPKPSSHAAQALQNAKAEILELQKKIQKSQNELQQVIHMDREAILHMKTHHSEQIKHMQTQHSEQIEHMQTQHSEQIKHMQRMLQASEQEQHRLTTLNEQLENELNHTLDSLEFWQDRAKSDWELLEVSPDQVPDDESMQTLNKKSLLQLRQLVKTQYKKLVLQWHPDKLDKLDYDSPPHVQDLINDHWNQITKAYTTIMDVINEAMENSADHEGQK